VEIHKPAVISSVSRLDLVNPSGYYRAYDLGGLAPTFFIALSRYHFTLNLLEGV
jgi:hypothetical protein